MTKVVNLRREKYTKYIGRPSILGNPFVIGRDGTREEVVAKYFEYVVQRMDTDKKFAAEVKSCKDETLGCFCHPLLCHGDILADLADNL